MERRTYREHVVQIPLWQAVKKRYRYWPVTTTNIVVVTYRSEGTVVSNVDATVNIWPFYWELYTTINHADSGVKPGPLTTWPALGCFDRLVGNIWPCSGRHLVRPQDDLRVDPVTTGHRNYLHSLPLLLPIAFPSSTRRRHWTVGV